MFKEEHFHIVML